MNRRTIIGYRTNDPPAPPLSPVLVFAIAVMILAVNFAVPKLGVLLGIGFAACAIWAARAEYLPALLIVQLSRSNFGSKESSMMDEGLGAGAISIAGVALTVQYMIGFTMAVRITYELFAGDTFRKYGMIGLLLLWYLAMPFALVMSVMGKFDANPSWTSTIRTVLMAGSFFYGMILIPTWPRDGRLIFRWLVPIITCLFLLIHLRLFYHMFVFLLTPLGVPFALFTMRQRGIQWKVLGIACAFVVGAYALGEGLPFVKGDDAVDAAAVIDPKKGPALTLGRSTFTLNGLLFVSTALAGLYFAAAAPVRRVVSWCLAIGAFPVVVAFSITIAILSPRFVASGVIEPKQEVEQEDLTIREKFMAKLFDDRSKIWNSALDNALHSPYMLRPAGRPLIVDSRWGKAEWPHGAHNVVLEVLKSLRWVAGVSVLAIVAVATFISARALSAASSPSLAILGIGTFATATIGCATGHYPLTDDGAFIFLGFAGLCAAPLTRGARSNTGPSDGTWGVPPHATIMTALPRTGTYRIVPTSRRGKRT